MPTFDEPDFNGTGMEGMFDYTSDVTDGALGLVLILLTFSGVSLSVPADFPSRIVVGSFAAAISSIFLFLMELVGESTMIVTVIAAGGSLIFVLMDRDGG